MNTGYAFYRRLDEIVLGRQDPVWAGALDCAISVLEMPDGGTLISSQVIFTIDIRDAGSTGAKRVREAAHERAVLLAERLNTPMPTEELDFSRVVMSAVHALGRRAGDQVFIRWPTPEGLNVLSAISEVNRTYERFLADLESGELVAAQIENGAADQYLLKWYLKVA